MPHNTCEALGDIAEYGHGGYWGRQESDTGDKDWAGRNIPSYEYPVGIPDYDSGDFYTTRHFLIGKIIEKGISIGRSFSVKRKHDICLNIRGRPVGNRTVHPYAIEEITHP